MKRVIALACCASLTATGFAIPSFASSTTRIQLSNDRIAPVPPPVSGRDYCRRPAALPDLGDEQQVNQQSKPSSPRGGRAYSSAAPAPPMAVAAPPPPSAEAAGSGDTISVTGSRAAAGADRSAVARSLPPRPRPPMPGPIPPRPPQPQPQSGLLTAGEHDDLLNPELYEDYKRKSNLGQQIQSLPNVDTGRLLTVELRDRRGRSVPFAEVEVRCEDGNSITLKTVADGRAVFFPGMDRLSDDVWVRAGGSDWRAVRLSNEPGAQTVSITQRRAAPAVQKLDLAVVVDVTGSMSDELAYLQTELTAIIGALETRHSDLDVRVAFTFYRDQGDQFVTRTFDFDGNVDRAQGRLGQQVAMGGGDYPEAMQDAMIRAARLDWRDDAVKTLLLVADAPPHNRDVDKTWLAAEHLRNERVHIVPVGASGVADMAEYVMRAMAAVTQSRYTFLTDDSGIGNPHAPPAIDCYLVTRLDHLLRRVIDSQLSGRRVEPSQNEIVRAVGQYDAGRCVLPPDFQASRVETGEDKPQQAG
ncbi:VWA domain-containing protein [Erythrobacter sp. Alg231-14]|uniref:VWA domain-containing protein n=1 Tax=Erythrobacter sp. Alg231-14 TaxID=1922225 RepID=UPI000D54B3B3